MTRPPLRIFQVSKSHQGSTLQQFLREELQLSNRQAKALVDSRGVFVNGKRIWMAKHALRSGDKVECAALPPPEKKIFEHEIAILFRDERILAVNKPAGLVSDRDAKSVEALLRTRELNPALRALHRLDRETSGLLLFLQTSEARERYLDLFRNQEILKVYQVLLAGQPKENEIVIRKSLDGKSAETRFRILKRRGEFCRAECQISTGRLHQIRRHALEMGCRVAGDRKHGLSTPASGIEKSLPRQMLHAFRVEFICPFSSRTIRIQAPLAADFQAAIQQLKLF
ncbi:MAG: RluA family pseudouridine synthase [Kiritimatiellia bacterium]